MKKINIVLVGLGFGGAFAEIYKDHPNIGTIGIYDTNKEMLRNAANHYGIDKIYDRFDEILYDDSVDAVHLVTPIPLHEEQTVQVLESGKHCACTVPMAISLDGIRRITEAKRRSSKNYMMMETTLYTYQFFYVKQMIASGKLGRIQFLRGSHYQDMANWPDYWMGLPPMYYGTHAIGPMVALSGSRINRVSCLGAGTMEEWLTKQYGNPFSMESAHFEFENGLKGEATRSLFETAREYQEGMFVYGSDKSFEWGFADSDNPYITTAIPAVDGRRGRSMKVEIVEMPNYHQLLPKEIQRFTVGGNYDPTNPQESLKKGARAGHHGSHPHLVHEFISSILENRKPWIDEVLGGNITAAGICAHESAMNNGAPVTVPLF
ncbi:Gfo/Idh/MocA family protein [Paenibacillus nasutitermitis]|uniref:Oxidoreductase n=1 Tax=Paenibacillus nasutitermitis TaxID=1652958 RepID=A0A916ZE70_9BACL|nr:Gfo/Idh/MocA family oxidoreductase [Paenibacillus nasutitermitis]GGD89942.1 oxidoreductase [Paenibacillus nasutitermitis]